MVREGSRESEAGLIPEREDSIEVESSLERLDGKHERFDIALLDDGKPKMVAFFDVDNTMIRLRSVYRDAIAEVFPEEPDREKLFEIYEAGFRLGSSRAEQIRMQGIFREGRKDWIDADVFESSYFDAHRQEINHPGGKLYETATTLLRQYDDAASKEIENEYNRNPASFDAVKIEPIYHLASIYKRLGIPMVCMSANPGKLIHSATKYLGLSEFFIDSASDWDVDGDKEYKMKWLIGKLEEKGVKVPYDRLEIVGDSLKGDIGSGLRFKQLARAEGSDQPVGVHGFLVVDSEEAVSKTMQAIARDRQLQELVSSLDVRTLELHNVSFSADGTPNLGSRHRSSFSRRLGG